MTKYYQKSEIEPFITSIREEEENKEEEKESKEPILNKNFSELGVYGEILYL